MLCCRRAAGGIQRGAGSLRNSFRRARGLPPHAAARAPEEPGPPTRPYGARAGARRYPGRGAAPQPPQRQPVPSVSAHTTDGAGRSELHPAYLGVSSASEFPFWPRQAFWYSYAWSSFCVVVEFPPPSTPRAHNLRHPQPHTPSTQDFLTIGSPVTHYTPDPVALIPYNSHPHPPTPWTHPSSRLELVT